MGNCGVSLRKCGGGGGSGGGNDMRDVELVNADNSVALFSLAGETHVAKVVNIYDGDTCKIVIKMGGRLVKFTCRMNGYDCPEMKPSKDKKNRDKEIAAAKAAKGKLIELVGGEEQLVFAKCGKFDKYGRLLVDMYVDNPISGNVKSVNQMMMDEGHGYSYDGGTKKVLYK